MADRFLKGMDWELEHGATTVLRISGEESVCGKLIPYQLRMMQEQAMDRLLPLAAEEAVGRIVFHYDLTGKRRLVQWLYAEPLSFRQYVELVHRLVRTVAECQQWMLHESGFVLHEDFVYAGRKGTDFRLCYLPLEGAAEGRIMPPVTSQLRRLLLRLLAFVQEAVPPEMAPVFALLSQEPYAIVQLEQALRKLRYGGMGTVGERERDKTAGKGFASPGFRNFAWLNRWRRKGREPGEPGEARDVQASGLLDKSRLGGSSGNGGHSGDGGRSGSGGIGGSGDGSGDIGGKSGSGGNRGIRGRRGNDANLGEEKTGLLAGGTALEMRGIRLVFSGTHGRETREMDADRFLIGRKPDSVHYVLAGEGVSRIHCELVRQADGVTAADLGSLNGTMLNGEAMLPYKQYPFRQGDVLQVAGTAIRLEPVTAYSDQAGLAGFGGSAAGQ